MQRHTLVRIVDYVCPRAVARHYDAELSFRGLGIFFFAGRQRERRREEARRYDEEERQRQRRERDAMYAGAVHGEELQRILSTIKLPPVAPQGAKTTSASTSSSASCACPTLS